MAFTTHKAKASLIVLAPPTPCIYVTDKALQKMWEYIDQSTKEIGWYGLVTEISTYNYRIEDVFLFRQTVGSVHTTATADSGFEVLEKLQKSKINPEDVRLWGHSHVNMGTSASGQDHKQMIESFSDHFPWAIRVIGNKAGRLEFSVFLYEENLAVEDVEWKSLALSEYREGITLEIANLVTEVPDIVITKGVTNVATLLKGNRKKGDNESSLPKVLINPIIQEFILDNNFSVSERYSSIYDREGTKQYCLITDINILTADAHTAYRDKYHLNDDDIFT